MTFSLSTNPPVDDTGPAASAGKERRLLADCRAGYRRAQAELYRRYYPTVRGVCRRYAAADDRVDDWVNRAYQRAFAALGQYDGRGAFGAWLRRIAVTTCLDELRKLKVLRERAADTDLLTHLEPVAPAALQRLAVADLVDLIQQLPAAPRTVFNLHVVEGFSHAEIATRTGISAANSRYYLRRARLLLQSYLKNQHS